MSQSCPAITSELNLQITNFCKHIAGSQQVTAIGLIDNCSTKTSNVKSTLQVILVILDFQPRIINYVKNFNGRNVIFFAVDQWIFERDIERGFLGEALASKLIFSHSSLYGEEYLLEKEIALKKRLILEALENLSLSYPELVYQIQIQPQYFIYEVMLNRVRVFPLLAYELSTLMKGTKLKNEDEALKSYNEALKQLEAEKIITFQNGYVTISKEFAIASQKTKVWFTNISKNAPRAIFTSFFGVLPQLVNIVSQNTEAILKTQKINWRKQIEPACYFVDPEKYVFMPTSEGLVSLAERVDIKTFARKMLSNEEGATITVKPIGGMLNDIYLINGYVKGKEKKVLVKRFKDWSGFKWFPLTLWSHGARVFAVSAKARLAKEIAASEFLRCRGFNVPKILQVSNAARLVFMEYIEGEDLSQGIKRIALATGEEENQKDFAEIEKAGEILAQVHAYNMTLGDTKPENMIITPNDSIYLLDFEQATMDGDKAWDIAEFLYYSGHYLQPLYSNAKAEAIVQSFIKGYLKAGGNPSDIKKAGASKYTRVFSVFTMPPVIKLISNICKKTESNIR